MRKQILLSLMTFLPMVASAYDIQIGEVYYFTSPFTKIASVAPGPHGSYSGEISIPSEIEYKNVTYRVMFIENDAFHGCNLTSITIPASVTKIEAQASPANGTTCRASGWRTPARASTSGTAKK